MEQHTTSMNFSPPETLLNQWIEEIHNPGCNQVGSDRPLADKAAQWGADEQLGQVCDWWNLNYPEVTLSALLDAMRPKPKSLAELAIEEWETLQFDLDMHGIWASDKIILALKRLKELEAQQ